MKQCSLINVQEKQSVTLEDILKVVAEQSKAIGELTNAVRDLTLKKDGERNDMAVKSKL